MVNEEDDDDDDDDPTMMMVMKSTHSTEWQNHIYTNTGSLKIL